MDKKPEFPSLPKEGFLKIVQPPLKGVSPAERVQLVRKGNRAFNSGDIELAKKIFLTVHYSEGISKVGDALYERGDIIEAFKMYKAAPDKRKMEQLFEKNKPYYQVLAKRAG